VVVVPLLLLLDEELLLPVVVPLLLLDEEPPPAPHMHGPRPVPLALQTWTPAGSPPGHAQLTWAPGVHGEPVELLLPPEPPVLVLLGVLEQATIVNAEETEARRSVEENKASEERVRMDELREASGPGRISDPCDVFETEPGRLCHGGGARQGTMTRAFSSGAGALVPFSWSSDCRRRRIGTSPTTAPAYSGRCPAKRSSACSSLPWWSC
jgi:hypothetical protein